jgi:hypothetical protein
VRVHFTLGFAIAAASALIGVASIGGLAAAGGKPMSTDLNPAEEVPGPGDPDASGHASITLNQGRNEVCFDLTWSDIDGTVVAAHIHGAAAGVAGPIVVGLFSGTFAGTDEASGCVEAPEDLVKAIRKDPSSYYVNVHSLPGFPAGAVRGQLGD